jgi:hypothetical protein
MGIFSRRKEAETPAAEAETDAPIERYRPPHCTSCKQPFEKYVYMSNGKDYCVDCARELMALMRVQPAGNRDGDITDLDAALNE